MPRYHLVVIGAGTGGYVAAIRAAQLGLRTAVVERQSALGGTCLNWGCIPTKALLEHAHVLKLAQQAGEWGITFGGAPAGAPTIDLAQVHARKNKIVSGLTKGIEFLFKKNHIDWIRGSARLLGEGRVEVSGPDARTLEADHIVLATGSAPRPAPGVPFDRRRIISSDEAIHLAAIPTSMAILGAGAVGVEFASIFRRFGSEVTLIEAAPRLVPNEDDAVSAELEKSFKKRGIAVRTATQLIAAAAGDSGVDIRTRDASGREEPATVDWLLVAIGRTPVTDGLGLPEAGVETDADGFVTVDDVFRTSADGISAIGDVIRIGGRPHPQLAHLSSAEGVVLAERLAGREVRPIDYDQVPACTYCDPEIGSVGLTEKAAAARGYEVRVGTFPFGALGRARIAGEVEGFVKIVADARYDQLLGVHMIGPRATELVAEAAAALRLESTVEELVRTIHAHPTMSEAIGEAAHALHGGAIHL
jgi:dihydrolipoamide dehydrogenase